ncbi:hypothetical protein [Roseateles cavernae]|uniref:hypothetical protein n=1 Tax=Roseateles cavernae TaxID=3153578 RepID=UPI0032E4FAF6
MELEAQSHRWESRMPDWPAAVVAGLVAGAVAMVMDLLWTTLMQGGNPWHTSHQVAAMLLGSELLQGPTQAFSLGVVATAMAIHYALGIVFGCIVAFIVTGFHYEGSLPMLEIVGGLFGIALYFINFYGMVRLFPWVAEMRSGAYLVEHLVFGMVAASVYWKLSRRGSVAD